MSRIAVCAVLFLTSGLLLCQRTDTALGQDKKEKAQEKIAALKQQLQNAEKQFAVMKQEIAQLQNANKRLQVENNRLEGIIKKEKIDDKKDDKTMKSLQTVIDGYRGAGLVHVVVLKLKSDSSSSEAQSVIDDTYSQLSKIKTVRGVWAGKPAGKGTPDANGDYTVALVFVFDDAAGLKTYLNDSIHTKFADKHLKLWETPTVYDFEPKKPAP